MPGPLLCGGPVLPVIQLNQRETARMTTILLVILILILLGALPTWGYSRSWGYGPSGVLGVVVIVLIILLLTGRL